MTFHHDPAPDTSPIGAILESKPTPIEGVTRLVLRANFAPVDVVVWHLSVPRIAEVNRKLPEFFSGEAAKPPHICGCNCLARCALFALWPKIAEMPEFWPSMEAPPSQNALLLGVSALILARTSLVERDARKNGGVSDSRIAHKEVMRLTLENLTEAGLVPDHLLALVKRTVDSLDCTGGGVR